MGTCNCIPSGFQDTTELTTNNPMKEEIMLKIRDNPKVLEKLIQIQARWKGLIVRDRVKVRRGKPVKNIKQKKSDSSIDVNIMRSAIEHKGLNQDQSKIIKDNQKANKQILEQEFNEVSNWYEPLNDGVEVVLRLPLEYLNQSLYYGEWNSVTSKRHGRGIQIWKDGIKYQGYWVNDKANLKGKRILSNGDYYEGEWVDDKAEGYGKYYHWNGARYEGYWKDNKQDGWGKEIWPDGSEYEGYYEKGMKSGEGKFQWGDGRVFKGNFENNIINGKGVIVWSDKRVYDGDWLNNKMHGYGIFTWPDGRKYSGHYKDNKKNGYGCFECPDGGKYKGNWKNGKRDGEGEFFDPKTQEWSTGIWVDGKRKKKNDNQKKSEEC